MKDQLARGGEEYIPWRNIYTYMYIYSGGVVEGEKHSRMKSRDVYRVILTE